MHLIAPLASGIVGAVNGSAVIRQASSGGGDITVYVDHAGETPYETSTVPLDVYGSAIVYVDDLVEVSVLDEDGSEVRLFIAGESSPAVEYRGPSFTGETGGESRAVNQPTTLKEILDLWSESAGASDFNVLVDGDALSLEDAITQGGGVGLYFNVKAQAYGAVGDGSEDDRGAIQAAIYAAETAGGGVVFFPAGTYRLSAGLTLPPKVSLLGVGYKVSMLALDDSGSADLLTVTSGTDTWRSITGLTLKAVASNDGVTIVFAGTVFCAVRDCVIGGSDNTGMLVSTTSIGPTTRLSFDSCFFTMGNLSSSDMIYIDSDIARLRMSDCVLTAPTTYTPTNGMIFVKQADIIRSLFDLSGTSSDVKCIVTHESSSAVTFSLTVMGCEFIGNGESGTPTAIDLGTYSASSVLTEFANRFLNGVTPYASSPDTGAENTPLVFASGLLTTAGRVVLDHGVTATAYETDGAGFLGYGIGAGAGAIGYGGSDNGYGVYGRGTAAGYGVMGEGGASGIGVYGQGGSSGGIGVDGLGTDSHAGVHGQGGESGGAGLWGDGGASSGTGVYGAGGSTAGAGGTFQGAGAGAGVVATGGETGRGVWAIGGTTDGVGVKAQGKGNGVALEAVAEVVAAITGVSTYGYGAELTGNVTSAPLRLTPQSVPSIAQEGDMYYDSSAHMLKFYNGTIWVAVA